MSNLPTPPTPERLRDQADTDRPYTVSIGIIAGLEVDVTAPDRSTAEDHAYTLVGEILATLGHDGLNRDLGHGVRLWVDVDGETMQVAGRDDEETDR